MPVGIGVWRIDQGVRPVPFATFGDESRLEKILFEHVELVGLDILILGRQVPTSFGKRIDLLGIDADGVLSVIELKRDRTPRDIVAQVLDYGSWVAALAYEDIVTIFEECHEGTKFEAAFADRFGATPPESLNESHELVIVASELDPSTERIVAYLAETYGVAINALFFRYLADGPAEYLTRTWLIDPVEAEAQAERRRKGPRTREPWNGRDFYISFGDGEHRSWDDARRYGFVSGGGKRWHTQTLHSLFPGARVFVCIPGTGYVGVGTVADEPQLVSEFKVDVEGRMAPILEAPLRAPAMDAWVGEPEREETLVPVDWVETRDVGDAVWETGMFANQNTACKLRNRFTLERLVEHFGLEE